MGVCTDISEGSFFVALMEGVMVVYVLERAAKALLAGWRYCRGWGKTVTNFSFVVAT